MAHTIYGALALMSQQHEVVHVLFETPRHVQPYLQTVHFLTQQEDTPRHLLPVNIIILFKLLVMLHQGVDIR